MTGLAYEPYDVLDAALGSVIVAVIRELRPDIPIPVIRSLAVEILERALVDVAWLERREALDPHMQAAGRNRHAGQPYATRRARELVAAAPTAGDYHGRSGVA